MGRLPATYAGMPIMFRVPFVMQTTKIITSGQNGVSFPEAPVTHGIDKPFEVHRMIPRITGLDSDDVPLYVQPDDDLMAALVSITLRDFGKNQTLLKVPSAINSLTRGSAERTWEWAEPYYLKQGDGFEIGARAVDFPDSYTADGLRVQISFEGFLVVLAPPMDRR